ncbi:IMPACT family protein [Mesoplasma photuris]|uniref:IMPACT family protein n=1 Tax=Mesoplasma photuris TaxID=217731 RepID=UPI0004E1E1FB|nr:YigZ family protein [Mesoplasma photuris]
MKTIGNKIYKNSFVINKSEFIAIAKTISSKKELEEFLLEYSENDANHNCFAYKIGVDNVIGGFNDDGEPNGTAGKPIFNVIEKMGLTNIVVLVIRYFGGIKLGAGPLTRAYTSSASELLNGLELFEMHKVINVTISFAIENSKSIDTYIRINNLFIIDKNYTDGPEYTLQIDDLSILKQANVKFEITSIVETYTTI